MGLINKDETLYYNEENNYGGLSDPQNPHYGDYQFTSLKNIIAQFMIGYVGEDKIISKIRRADVAFFAQRALQELSFDTFKSCKTQEIEVAPSLTMPIPQDYVNYVKLTWSDASGIEHIIYPTRRTSNPRPILQDDENGNYQIEAVGTLTNLSTLVALDGIYKTILVGMRIKIHSANPQPVSVQAVSTDVANEITYITMSVPASYTGKEKLAFSVTQFSPPQPGFKIMLQPESSYLLKASFTGLDDKITIPSTEDTSGLKIGMLVSQGSLDPGPIPAANNWSNNAPGTRIHDIVTESNGDTTVTVSPWAVGGTSTNVTAQTYVAFISYDVVSDTWSRYQSATPSENANDDYEDDTYWPNVGQRYGLSPEDANVNGSFFMDCKMGKIHFSSNLSGKTIILKYISDSLGTDEEMKVHKFAEEAMYKWIAYNIMSTRANVPEYIVSRLKKEKFAETRKAKLRLSNIKLEEITQIFRGKSKQIKH